MQEQNQPAKILIVDDEVSARYGLRKALEHVGYTVCEAADGKESLRAVTAESPDVVLLDINMPVMDGMEALEKITAFENPPLIIMLTAHGSERIAVDAMKKGAYDYMIKPFEVDELRLIIKNALEKINLRRENMQLQRRLANMTRFGSLIAESEAMKRVFQMIERIAATDVAVLIQGESGTGKELVAREIHRRSLRKNNPFVCINSAALPETLIESELFGYEKGAFTGAVAARDGKFFSADGGTIFFDEIGDMSPNTQAKILRVLEEKQFPKLGGNKTVTVDVRVISASNKDLASEITKGNFREDLYYRLKVVDIIIPPLRERTQDIPLLTQNFVGVFAERHRRPAPALSPSAVRALVSYPWPGNVRQLENLLEKVVLLCSNDVIEEYDIRREFEGGKGEAPQAPQTGTTYQDIKKAAIEEFERGFITEKLQEFGGNISQTARALGMHRQSLQHKLKELGISAKEDQCENHN
jgi:two-component system response regulator AtoC/two-component system nitrogen regulation response regulator NtrX